RSSNSALRIRRRAVEKGSLGEHHHVAIGGSAPCGVKTSNTASHHEKARSYPLGHTLKSMRDMMHLKGGESSCNHVCSVRFFCSDEKTDHRHLLAPRCTYCAPFHPSERHRRGKRDVPGSHWNRAGCRWQR